MEIENEAKVEKKIVEELFEARAKEIISEKSWSQRMHEIEAGWSDKRNDFLNAIVKHQALPAFITCNHCGDPQSLDIILRYNSCKEYFCHKCDKAYNFKRPFPHRELFLECSSRSLKPGEFL